MKNDKTRRLVLSAMLIAIGTAISLICEYIPFLNLPFGGTITIASLLPLVIISYMYGVRWGLVCGFVYAVLQMMVGMRTVSALFTPTDDSFMGIGAALTIVIIDYILAFTSVGLGGMFRNKLSKTKAFVLGSVTALALCWFFHFLSGAIFYGAWAEWFFTDTVLAELSVSKWIMSNFKGASLSMLYSFVYNGCYMLPEIVITALAAVPVSHLTEIKKD